MKPQASSAEPTEPPRSCVCPDVSTSPGKTKIPSASTPTPERRPACSASAASSLQQAHHPNGKASPSRPGKAWAAAEVDAEVEVAALRLRQQPEARPQPRRFARV